MRRVLGRDGGIQRTTVQLYNTIIATIRSKSIAIDVGIIRYVHRTAIDGRLREVPDNANAIIAGVKNGKGTVGQLLQNDSLFNSLNSTIGSLDLLVQDIKANPSKYINVTIFGRKEQRQERRTERKEDRKDKKNNE